MSDACNDYCASKKSSADPRYRKILWIALLINFSMFAVELISGVKADSASLLADAIDFFGDAANYGVTLFVLTSLPIIRARAALLKGISMATYGLFVICKALYSAMAGVIPDPTTMGTVGVLALFANSTVAFLLFSYREGDANMRSVWLCTRNDAIGNVAVMLAALGVFGTGTAWPDLLVGLVMAGLALHSGQQILQAARIELTATPHAHTH